MTGFKNIKRNRKIMNRKDFLKRLGLLTTLTPVLLAENLQSQPATTESVERMRFHNDGRVTYKDEHENIINVIRYDT
jgi:hypothetical protein